MYKELFCKMTDDEKFEYLRCQEDMLSAAAKNAYYAEQVVYGYEKLTKDICEMYDAKNHFDRSQRRCDILHHEMVCKYHANELPIAPVLDIN